MKRTRPLPAARWLDSLRFRPTALRLEERDVPATFYFDPSAHDNGNGTATFDFGLAGAHTGTLNGSGDGSVFTTLDGASAAAKALAGRDTIRFATGNITMTDPTQSPPSPPPTNNGMFNDAGGVDLVGDGTAATILKPNYDNSSASAFPGVLEFFNGTPFSVSNLTIDASGHNSSSGISASDAGTVGTINNVDLTNIAFPIPASPPTPATQTGVGVNVSTGASVTVQNSTFAGIGRYGVFAQGVGTSVQVFGNTYTGKGAGTGLDYLAAITNQSTAVISGNLVTNAIGSFSAGSTAFSSAAVIVQNAGGTGAGAASASIFGNTFSNVSNGVIVGANNADTSTATIEYNNLAEVGHVGISTNLAPGQTVTANYNYWGATTGPTSATYTGGTGASADAGVVVNEIRENPITRTVAPTLQAFLSTVQPIGPTLAVGGATDGASTTLALTRQGTFNAGTGDQRVAVGDVNGDGVNDVVVGSGPGTAGTVTVFDGKTGAVLYRFAAMDGFTGGLFVAVGDFNRDGKDEIVVTPGVGGGPRVQVFDLSSGAPVVIQSYYALDPNLRTGLSVAVGDVNGDRTPDIVVLPGPGGGPEAAFFDGRSMFLSAPPPRLFNDQFLADSNLRTGFFIALGDVTGDGFADYAVSTMSGNSRTLVWDGRAVMSNPNGTNAVAPLDNFFADPNNAGSTGGKGSRTALTDLNGDGRADLVSGNGDSSSTVRVFFANTNSLSSGTADDTIDLLGTKAGVFVG